MIQPTSRADKVDIRTGCLHHWISYNNGARACGICSAYIGPALAKLQDDTKRATYRGTSTDAAPAVAWRDNAPSPWNLAGRPTPGWLSLGITFAALLAIAVGFSYGLIQAIILLCGGA